MLFVAFYLLVLGSLVDQNLGCKCEGGKWVRIRGKTWCIKDKNRDVEDKWSDTLDVRQWTIGVCFEGKQACLNERYDGNNITEIAGIQLATLRPGSPEFALLESLTFPSVESMNCEELCNCLSCGHGQCSDNEDQDKCPGNTSGFICRCSNSKAFPAHTPILRDMMTTGLACRRCENL